MEYHQESSLIGKPTFLIGDNYLHWKVKMEYFLKMRNKKAWNAIELVGILLRFWIEKVD